jgi:hypothetical protein|eukprot:COSAG06_NODE_10368_length_1694_cov_1.540439_1_plen_89_part_00
MLILPRQALGTNIGKTQKRDRFLADIHWIASPDAGADAEPVLNVGRDGEPAADLRCRDTGFFGASLYWSNTRTVVKTGSGQTQGKLKN